MVVSFPGRETGKKGLECQGKKPGLCAGESDPFSFWKAAGGWGGSGQQWWVSSARQEGQGQAGLWQLPQLGAVGLRPDCSGTEPHTGPSNKC